jgi:cell division septation protein DedD
MRQVAAPVAALSLVALLAVACGQQQSSAPSSAYSGYNRPSSYDPPGPPGDPWGPWIREAARRYDVPERWIREVMRQESGGRPGATSPVGAMGLMQVMPGTYRELRAKYGLGDDPYHPYDSIMAGTAYIREMYDLYGSPAFLAAYNAGPRRLEDYLWNSRGLPAETRNYVRRIGPRIAGTHPQRRTAPEVYAAAEIPTDIPPGPRRMDAGTMMALREQRQAVDPGVQVAQLPAGTVVRMDPIPDGSTTPPAPPSYQVAALGNSVVRMDPIPDGSTYAAPLPPVAEPVREAPSRPVPAAAPGRGSNLTAAALPPPAPRGGAPASRDSRAAAPTRLAAVPPRTSGRQAAPAPRAPVLSAAHAVPPAQASASRSRFGVLGTAHAAVPPTPAAAAMPAGGGWAVQVGAFSSEAQARSAAAAARNDGRDGRAVVQPVAQGRNTLYRARVTGLSRGAAQQICDRMRSRGGCTVLSPGQQG